MHPTLQTPTLAALLAAWCGKVSYGFESWVFEQIGRIRAVIVEPGSIEQAYKPNEFVEVEQLEK